MTTQIEGGIHPADRAAFLAPQESALSPAGAMLDQLQRLEDGVAACIERLPSLTDEEVKEIMHKATLLEKSAFIIRGACAAEIKRRLLARVAAQGKSEETYTNQLGQLGKELGVSVSALKTDALIHEKLTPDPASPLTREHYRVALTAPDPVKAKELAENKLLADGRYSAVEFAKDVAAIRATPEDKREARTEELEWSSWVSTRLSQEDYNRLVSYANTRHCSPADALRLLVCGGLEVWKTPLPVAPPAEQTSEEAVVFAMRDVGKAGEWNTRQVVVSVETWARLHKLLEYFNALPTTQVMSYQAGQLIGGLLLMLEKEVLP